MEIVLQKDSFKVNASPFSSSLKLSEYLICIAMGKRNNVFKSE